MKKRSILLSFSLVVITVISTNAQGIHLGVKAGANIMKISGQSYSSGFNFGYNLGAFAEINFPGKWGIQPELLFNQTKYHTGQNFKDIYTGIGISDVKGSLNYLSIPILASYRPIKLLSLQAGPQFGILMSQQKDLVNNGKDAFKKGDFSLVGGAQLNLKMFKAGVRYIIGLTDANDLGSSESWKNQGFQVYVGYRFF